MDITTLESLSLAEQLENDMSDEIEWITMPDKTYYSTKEVAEAFGVTPDAIRMAKMNNQIKAVSSDELPGRDTYYTQEAIQAYAANKGVKVLFENN